MLSPTEEKLVNDYDKSVIDQNKQDREYEKRPIVKVSLDLLFDALINEAIDNIKEATFEINVFSKCKETFNTQYTNDMSNYFIILAKYSIEDEYDNITRWRAEKESCRLRRG